MTTEETPKSTIDRLQLLKQKALQNNNRLFKVQRPEVLRQKLVDWNSVRVKPWHQKRSDLTDFFNYGFNEHTFQQYSTKIEQKLEQYSSQIQNSYRDRLEQKTLPYEQAQTLKDQTPLDYGGLNVPFDQDLIQFGGQSNNLHFLDSIFFLNNLNYDTSMLSEFDCYCTSEDLLYGNKHLVQLYDELNSKLQFEIEEDIEKPSMYSFQKTIKKLNNSVQRSKPNAQNPIVNAQTYPHLLVMPGIQNNKYLINQNIGSLVQGTPSKQLALFEKSSEDNGLLLKQNILQQTNVNMQDDVSDKMKKKKKEKKIKKDRREKKDKKKRKHKKDKKSRKQQNRDMMDIEFEHMSSDHNPTPKQVIFQDSESSYLQSNQESNPSPNESIQKQLSCEDGIPLEQGNQGISINQEPEIESNRKQKSYKFVQVIQDKIVMQQQPKPVWMIPSDQSSPEYLPVKEDLPIKARPPQLRSWPMNQITGILLGNNIPRRLIPKKINKEN